VSFSVTTALHHFKTSWVRLHTVPERKLNLPREKIVDWESIFERHKQELEREEKQRRERIETARKLETGWELARVCRSYIQTYSKNWKSENEEREKWRKKKGEKQERKRKANEKTETFQTKQLQKKITETLKQLPAREREKALFEEERKRKFELKEMKENLWKKWRKEGKEMKETESEKQKLERNLKKLEKILEKIKREEREMQEREKIRK
jgi:hypothetical protein